MHAKHGTEIAGISGTAFVLPTEAIQSIAGEEFHGGHSWGEPCGLIVAKIPPKDQKVDDMAPGSPNGNNNVTSMPKDSELYKAKRIEALRKYEILVEFEKQLIPVFGKHENR
ncbi:hypothetical protein OROGR_032397 [Orobanche gracilis]